MIKWLALAILASLAGTTLAQTEPAAKKKPPAKQELKKASANKFSMGMLEGARIDPKFTGYSATEVIAAIERQVTLTKGEFESTADYNARKEAARTAKLLPNTSLDDVFAFIAPVPNGGKDKDGLSYAFDAETGDVKLYVLPKSSKYAALNGIGAPDYLTNKRESKGLDQFELSTKVESSSTYEANNVYGATVMVEKASISKAGIAANRIPFLGIERDTSYANPTISAQFKWTNARAAAELPTLKALIVMKLSAPYILYNFIHKEPKRDSPTDVSVQDKFLTGDVMGIVFYSGKTGEIFARVPEGFGVPAPKVEVKPEDKPAG